MPDLKQRLDAVDQIPVGDLWPEIRERFDDEAAGRVTPLRRSDPSARPEVGWRKALTIAAVFVFLAAVGIVLVRSLTSDGVPANPPDEPAPAPVEGSGDLAYALAGDIYVADPDGSNAVKIVDGVADDGCPGVGAYWSNSMPAWSPDGRYIAFWHDCSGSDQGQETTVMVVDPLGSVVGEFPKGLWGFTWSPDSTHIAVWGGDLTSMVDVYGIDGELVASLDFPPRMRPHNDAWPGWMPDGRSILLQGEFVVPLDGSAPYDLGLGGSATYSPDGSRVAVMTDASMRVLDADGSIVAQVNDVEEVVWSTDGERLAFASGQGELSVVDAATGTVTTLPDASAALTAGGEVFIVRGFSPDGDRILYVAGRLGAGGSADVWSIGVDGSDPVVVIPGVIQGAGRPV